MIVILKFILAHLIGDFLLQPKAWVAAKEVKKAKAWQLYAHIAIHFLLLIILFNDISYLPLIALVTAFHLLIDFLKLQLQTDTKKLQWFLADQLAHLLTILFFGLYFQNKEYAIIELLTSEKNIIIITALLFLTTPTAITLSLLVKPWTDTIVEEKEKSLQNAGQYIGIIERILVFVFIVTNHFGAVGFLLATKSVFRFGDLSQSKDRKLTEYVLIGTLLSFGIAIITGLLAGMLLKL